MDRPCEYGCRRCHGQLKRLEQPFVTTDESHIGPHDQASHTIAQTGRYEGTAVARWTHSYEFICDRCNTVFTADQVELYVPPACQSEEPDEYELPAQTRGYEASCA